MQLAAAGHVGCLFEGKMLIVHLNGDNLYSKFSFGEGGISLDIRSEIRFYGSAYALP